MFGNLNPSARMAVAGFIAPQQAAAGTITSGWVDMRDQFALLALVNVGVIGASGTIDARIEQATDSTGAGAKVVPGSAITQLVKAGGDNRQAAINLRQEDLDKNGFRFARLSLTVGTASSFVSAILVGVDQRYGAADAAPLGSVAQIVS